MESSRGRHLGAHALPPAGLALQGLDRRTSSSTLAQFAPMRRASSFGSLDRQIAAAGHDDHTIADKWRDRELPPNITREITKLLSGEAVPETAVIGHYRFINSSVLVSAGRGFRLTLPRHTRAAFPCRQDERPGDAAS